MPSEERIAIALRYFASGERCSSLSTMDEDKVKGSPTGVAYEIVLKPASETARRPNLTPTRPSPVKKDIEELKEKQRRAHELRKSFEEVVCNKFQEKKAKIEQIKKENELTQAEEKKQKKETVEKKCILTDENREAKREAMLARLQAHDKKIEEARQTKEKSVIEKSLVSEEKLNRKLESAEMKREIRFKEKLERLQAHDAKVEERKHRNQQRRLEMQSLQSG